MLIQLYVCNPKRLINEESKHSREVEGVLRLRRMRIEQLKKLIEMEAAPAAIEKQRELILQTFNI